MKPNFKCPKCKTMQCVGKRLHASWKCPKCGQALVLTKEIVQKGYMPYRKNFLYTNKPQRKFFNKSSENQLISE